MKQLLGAKDFQIQALTRQNEALQIRCVSLEKAVRDLATRLQHIQLQQQHAAGAQGTEGMARLGLLRLFSLAIWLAHCLVSIWCWHAAHPRYTGACVIQ